MNNNKEIAPVYLAVFYFIMMAIPGICQYL